MKQSLRLYLDKKDIEKLRESARQHGFEGHGALSHYISKVATSNIIFVTDEVLTLLSKEKRKV